MNLKSIFSLILSIHFIFRTCHMTKVYVIDGDDNDDDDDDNGDDR